MINHRINRRSSSADFIGNVAKQPIFEENIDKRNKIVGVLRSLIAEAEHCTNPSRQQVVQQKIQYIMDGLYDMGRPLKKDEIVGAERFIWEHERRIAMLKERSGSH